MWEMFNEMDLGGHDITPAVYTQIYDAIAMGIKEVQPTMEFVGLALGSMLMLLVKWHLNNVESRPHNKFQYFARMVELFPKYFKSHKRSPFRLEYVLGSAVIANN